MGELNGEAHLDAEAPSPEAASIIRIEATQRLHGVALSMLLALVTGNGVDSGQVNHVMGLLGATQSPIIKV